MNRQKFMLITCLAMLVTALWGINQVQAMPASPTDESKVPHYFGPYPNWALSPLPVVTPTGNAVTGNAVTARGTATDTAANVFVVNATPLPAGTLTGFNIYVQPGSGPNTFHAYVLRGNLVLFDSGPLEVPSVATGQELSFSMPGIAIQAGDVFAHYGPGIPIDIGTGTDSTYYPANTAPVQGSTITLGGTDFPVLAQARTYSIAATVATPPTVSGGIKKFTDPLPGLCMPPECPTSGKYIPLAVAEAKTYNGVEADEYEIGLVQYRTSFSSSLPNTLVRGYVQLETAANVGISQHYPLTNANLDPNQPDTPVMINGSQAYAVTPPQYLGPTILATKDRPVRIVFRNLLPTGSGGDMFLPTDSSIMGSGMGPMAMGPPFENGTVMDEIRNPMCTEYPKGDGCFKDNRATLHLHGGVSPWISDGTAHQWTTPAGETTPWPQGVSVKNVPDMADPGPGALTFYYTNQQSARLMFYHDHAWGITRLNVYAGEAAGYLITDDTEKALVNNGIIPGAADTIPLVVQDRTFVPDATQLAAQDPTWDVTRWGGFGNLWYHHVYMPAQNPGDVGGMSGYGRWMYGPWFWPPATPPHGPIANPYYNDNCHIDNPATWQYQTDPFCEPEFMPGTPNISVGMEQFNDTPIVNGTAYPTVTLEPKTYRLRILNAANDRFFNFQWYVAADQNSPTEVALNAAELAAAQLDPVVFPTPDTTVSPAGPSWIQIGTEGGFLPAPVVIPNQPITWITDPTRFDVGNVDLHSLLLAPAERADVIVDFSQFAGKTLILYNDAPAAFPARVPSYDYYTGAPDLSPVGAPGVLPGYGPNTRTIMQVKIAGTPAQAYNLTALQNAFMPASATNTTGIGVFKNGQPPIIVGQAGYNSAYGTSFPSSSYCNAPGSTKTLCDGFARINDQGGTLFGFNTLFNPLAKFQLPVEPKAIHDEMNAVAFDEFGRMTANLGVEAVPATPAAQNVTLYPFVNPQTELINGTNLPVHGINVQPISSADGTQIWKITHNGVDTHPIHFHLYDVQVINRVTWDNIVIPPDANELGWKDTVRISPLEDTIVALRPIIPTLPFDLPNSIRPLNPMMPAGDITMFNNSDPQGNPTAPIVNQLVNFGWEYVYHCHILSHEEMDMMRPVSVALPPKQPDGLGSSITGSGGVLLSWNDNSINETAHVVQRMTGTGAWTNAGTIPSPLNAPNTTGVRTFDDSAVPQGNTYQYRVVAQNTVGYGGAFPSMTVQSTSTPISIVVPLRAPTSLAATFQAGTGSATWLPPRVQLSWTDNATGETGFGIERAINGGAFAQIAIAPALAGTGPTTFVDTTIQPNTAYSYRVRALNGTPSAYSLTATVTTPNFPVAPAIATIAGSRVGVSPNDRVTLTWNNLTNETGYTVQRATNATFTAGLVTSNLGANVTTFTTGNVPRNTTFYFRVRAFNAVSPSAWSAVRSVLTP